MLSLCSLLLGKVHLAFHFMVTVVFDGSNPGDKQRHVCSRVKSEMDVD